MIPYYNNPPIKPAIIRGKIAGVGDKWRPGDNTTKSHEVTRWGVHRDMAAMLFFCFWNGNGNKKYAAKWAIDFIIEHQNIKDKGSLLADPNSDG